MPIILRQTTNDTRAPSLNLIFVETKKSKTMKRNEEIPKNLIIMKKK